MHVHLSSPYLAYITYNTKRVPTQYSDYIPSDSIVDMLLHLDDIEIATLLTNMLTQPTKCPPMTDIRPENGFTMNLIVDDKRDPLTLQHAKQSKYWNEWLTTMHKELEALKAKSIYEKVEELPHGRRAIQCKWVLHIK
jgi:hypothetical protein